MKIRKESDFSRIDECTESDSRQYKICFETFKSFDALEMHIRNNYECDKALK